MILPVFILSITVAVISTETQITKRDGETVTLQMNKSMSPVKDYLWTYGQVDPITAITIVTNGEVTRVNGTGFEDRLNIHVATGSITISNLNINDSGAFLVQVFTQTGILTQRFDLTVLENTPTPVDVLEGANVTLDPGLKQLKKEHYVQWTRGPGFVGKQIAQWKNFSILIEESFKGFVQLNPLNGALTIIRATQNYAGFYCVKMLYGLDPHILRQYLLKVYEPVSEPHVSTAKHSLNDENCYLSCSEKNGPSVNLTWYKGEKIINQTSSKDISSNLTLPLVIKNQEEGIFSCVARNPVSNETFTVNSTLWCPSHGADTNWIWWITGGIVGFGFLVLVFIAVSYMRGRPEGARGCFELRYMTEGTPPEPAEASEGSNGSEGALLSNSRGRV